MFGKFLKKDPEGAKLPLGPRLLKGMFTSCVSITTGVFADNLYMTAYKALQARNTEPPTPPSE